MPGASGKCLQKGRFFSPVAGAAEFALKPRAGLFESDAELNPWSGAGRRVHASGFAVLRTACGFLLPGTSTMSTLIYAVRSSGS
jgi:hypothetical protein